MTTKAQVTICETCRRDRTVDVPLEERDGYKLAQAFEAQQGAYPDLEIRRFRCLMGCEKACNVALQQAGKTSYVFDGFDANEETALAVLDYAQHYQDSEDGTVAFRNWPEGIKGHFRSKVPPAES